jgi:ABC-type antimicrobial peptide transport system permease subunit
MSAQAMAPQIRRIVRETDPTLPVHNVASMDQIVASSISSPRSYAVVSGVFAVVALVMAMIGLYSVMSYFVGQRTREFGVRMALGAGRREVLWLVLRQGFALTSGGIVLGLAGGAATTHFLDTMLFGLEPLDATTFAAAAVVFMTVAALACLIPARHATNVDPLVALRSE